MSLMLSSAIKMSCFGKTVFDTLIHLSFNFAHKKVYSDWGNLAHGYTFLIPQEMQSLKAF